MSKEEIEIEAKEIHAPVRKKFLKRKIITIRIDDLWVADLVILSTYEDKNKSYKYVLNVIDMFSKYVWTTPLKRIMELTLLEILRKLQRIQLKLDMNLHFYYIRINN